MHDCSKLTRAEAEDGDLLAIVESQGVCVLDHDDSCALV